MKHKYFFTYLGLAIVIVTSMIIYSCQKEKTGITTTSGNSNEQSLKDAQLEKRIIAFRNKLDLIRENPTLKEGNEPMEIDSAVWYIEAATNLTYGDASTTLDEYIIDSSFIDVLYSDGKIQWLDVQVAYDQIIDSLSNQFNSISANEKQLIAADISLEKTTRGTATFKVTSVFGSESAVNSVYSPFGEYDYWTWGMAWVNNGGYCDGPYAGTHTDSDAAEEIEYKINGRKPVPVGNYYYTDISHLEVYGDDQNSIKLDGVQCDSCSILNINDSIPYDNMYDLYLFRSYSEYPNHHGCLNPDEMNFYLDKMEDIVYTYAYQWFPNELQNKSFVSIDITGDAILNYTSLYLHRATIDYGIVHISSNPPKNL